MPDTRYNWQRILEEAQGLVIAGEISGWRDLARKLNVSRTTLKRKWLEAGLDEIESGVSGRRYNSEQPPEETSIERPQLREEYISTKGSKDALELSSRTRRIKSLDDLISECNIDLEQWEIERWIANKWEVGAKDDSGNVNIEPLFQIKVWLRRKKENATTPTIQPIIINMEGCPKNGTLVHQTPAISIALFMADPHFGFSKNVLSGKLKPFHDRNALNIALQIIADNHFDDIIVLGDILDLPEWTTKFIKSPEFYWTTQPAIVEAAWWLSQIKRAAPKAKITVVFGNHEQRIENTISEHLMASWQLRPGDEDINAAPSLSVARLLSLEKLNIEYISSYPDGELWLNGHIRAIHGSIARKASLDTARNVILENNTTTIMGHIHRIELASRTFHDSTGERTIYAFCPGCLCRTDGGVPGSVHPQWQQGLGVIQYTETDITQITAVTIGGRSAIYNHKEYKANPDIQAIEKETNWRLT